MEVSAKTLREVEFREKMRGYHPEDVDNFLEQVASGIESLQDRVRQAVERAQRAESAANEVGGTDDTLRKTLVLAQRTADLAVQEAREQASRILGSAEQQAQSIINDAEERGRRTHEDAINEARAELGRLETLRTHAQQEVDTLQRWVEEHRTHLQASLSDALASVERAGVLWPPPASRPIDSTQARSEPAQPSSPPQASSQSQPQQPPQPLVHEHGRPGAQPAPPAAGPRPDLPPPPPQPQAAPPPQSQPHPQPQSQPEKVSARDSSGQDPTVLWSPPPDQRNDHTAPSAVVSAPSASSVVLNDPLANHDDDAAMDDFFDDDGAYGRESRLGGRLRRRR